MPLFKVYISSTYIDLKDHRKAVRDFFGKFRDKFEVISMEDYVADSELPVDKCVADVKRCDFYILIIANRYGFIPADSTQFPNPGQVSVTHAEYLAATATNKKIFAFFADATAGFESDNDNDPAIKKLKQDKLKNLKDDVRNKYLTHPESFNSPYQLALMVAESMMKAGEKYADLLLAGARQQLIDRYINQDRVYCLDRIPQFNRYLNTRIESKSLFKPIIIHGSNDSLVESLQKRITEITLNIPKSKIYKTSFNGIFGTGSDYEDAKCTFLNAAFQQLFSTSELTGPLKDFKDLALFINGQQQENRVAFIINWTKLLNKEADPRIIYLTKLLDEIYDACQQTNCRSIFLFININYKQEDEKAFIDIIADLCKSRSNQAQYLFALQKLSPVISEDLGLWIDNYITEIPSKKNRIISEYLKELDDEFSMQEAEEKMLAFINKVNDKDPQVLQILN